MMNLKVADDRFCTIKSQFNLVFQLPEAGKCCFTVELCQLNASTVGKGLSKDAKAQNLGFQHWIEAIDPRHRYGHSLTFTMKSGVKVMLVSPSSTGHGRLLVLRV